MKRISDHLRGAGSALLIRMYYGIGAMLYQYEVGSNVGSSQVAQHAVIVG